MSVLQMRSAEAFRKAGADAAAVRATGRGRWDAAPAGAEAADVSADRCPDAPRRAPRIIDQGSRRRWTIQQFLGTCRIPNKHLQRPLNSCYIRISLFPVSEK